MKKIDPDFSNLKRKLNPSKNFFLSLATSIIHQQISTKAGESITNKFLKLFGRKKVTPENFLKLSDTELRSAGLSPQKLNYLKDLAFKFASKAVKPEKLKGMADEDIRSALIEVKGVGRWTADMFLIFALNRPNVLPLGDLGIKNGFKKVFGLKSIPNDKTMINLASKYEGKHTFLALFLWESLDSK